MIEEILKLTGLITKALLGIKPIVVVNDIQNPFSLYSAQ